MGNQSHGPVARTKELSKTGNAKPKNFLNPVEENVPAVIPREIALCLYRIVQESLKNITKHSRAESADIFLKGGDSSICVTVKDAGVGFDPLQVRHKPGLGLASMRERALLVNGDFSVESQPGKGTVINVCVPLPGGEA